MRIDHQGDHPPDREADHEATGLTIGQAARALGVSENAVRQRIKRRSVPASKAEGVWRVWLPDHEGRPSVDHEADHSGDQEGDYQPDHEATAPPGAVSPAARSQLEAIRDEWLAPLVAQIREQAERIGRLDAEREAVVRERDDLAARLAGDRDLADRLVDALQAERDALAARVRDLETLTAGEIAVGHPTASPEAPGAAQPPNATPDTPAPALSRWRRMVRALVGS